MTAPQALRPLTPEAQALFSRLIVFARLGRADAKEIDRLREHCRRQHPAPGDPEQEPVILTAREQMIAANHARGRQLVRQVRRGDQVPPVTVDMAEQLLPRTVDPGKWRQ